MKEITHKVNGMTTHIIPTKKYKTTTLVLRLKAPLTKDNVTMRALLPYVLQSGTTGLPTTAKLRTYLDELYGATLHVDLSKKGSYHIMTFRMEVANEKFLSTKKSLLQKAVQLLHDIIFTPVLENGSFVNKIVEQEKRSLQARISAVFDDKMRYSIMRLVQEMCKEEEFSLQANGELADVAAITPLSLFSYYQQALEEDEIDLYVIGDVEEKDVIHISSILDFVERTPLVSKGKNRTIEPKEITENQPIKQGKLNIGFRTNATYSDKDYGALQVFNGIFGGFSHSKLFINVREKASLAYYASSQMESHKGLLFVMAGIENNRYSQAVDIIHEQMQTMKNGDFTDDEITQTKAMIQNQVLTTQDTAYGMMELLYHNVIAENKKSIETLLTDMNNATREQIIEVANKVELDTTYFLTEAK